MRFHHSSFDPVLQLNDSPRSKIIFHIFASIIKMFEFSFKIIYKQALIMNYAELNIDKLTVATEMLKAIAHPMRIAIVGYLDGGINPGNGSYQRVGRGAIGENDVVDRLVMCKPRYRYVIVGYA